MTSLEIPRAFPDARSPESPLDAQSVFVQTSPVLGAVHLRPLEVPEDIPIIHPWVSADYARFWGMTGLTPRQVTAAYREIMRDAVVYLGFADGRPAFLLETYDPKRDPIGEHYAVETGDRGMHILVGPAEKPTHDFTWAVFSTVMDFLFSDPNTARVVVEPDVRNSKIHALNRRAGFRYQKMIELGSKTAHLAFCTRADYRRAQAREDASGAGPAAEPLHAHLTPSTWAAVNRALLAKMISELSHEALLAPRLVAQEGPWGRYVLTAQGSSVSYAFKARKMALDHWCIDADSLEKAVDGQPAALDAAELVLELNDQLAISEDLLPVYLQEITSTLYAAAYKRAGQRLSSADLVHASFQEVERAMTEGHPCFIANSGRVGFDAEDYLAYAPETGAEVRVVWLAAHKRHAEVHCAADLSYEALVQQELGAEQLADFAARLRELGLEPADYLLLPVHPWQWFNRLALLLTSDLASRDLVCLGYGRDRYQAQQSIRTFFNLSHPHKRYVKMALSVLNMGFMRGLSADYMRNTPAINDWIRELIAADPTFAELGFDILREVAGVGYQSPTWEAAAPKGSPYRKLLAALWRESPVRELGPGRRLMTMAALLHRDRDGHALLPQLIFASGLDADRWLERYLRCYLTPLVHCFYRYDLAFMPHGENIILVLEDNVPVKVLLKDIAEEAVVMDATRALPERVARVRADVPEDLKLLSIFTDLFDCIFRFMAPILVEQADYPEERFWGQVARCLLEYHEAHPELAAKLRRYDLFAPTFARSCLNRLQLRDNQQMVDLTDPAKNLQLVGMLDNPIAPHAGPR